MSEEFDGAVRRAIYTGAAARRIPLAAEVAHDLSVPTADVNGAFRRLAASRALVLQPDGEILMAEPFSAVPTAFVFSASTHDRHPSERGARFWFASCIWDALGIPAMLKIDGQVETSCQCCGQRLVVRVASSVTLVSGAGVAHVAVPVAAWWNDIVFT